MKRCLNCNIEKNVDDFCINRNKKDGRNSICKNCSSVKHKFYYENNKEKLIENQKNYYQKNIEKIIDYKESYREKNKDIILEKQREENIDDVREYNKKYNIEYKEKNKEKLKELRKDWEKRNKHIVLWRSILKRTLNQFRKDKKDSTYNLLGYNAIELKEHIESLFTEGMSWKNYGEWQVDHVLPLCSFDKNTHPSIVNSLSNLRPLWTINKEANGVLYEGNLNRKRHKIHETL
jgi:hypothetical protein